MAAYSRSVPVPHDGAQSAFRSIPALIYPPKALSDISDYALDPAEWLEECGDALCAVDVSVPEGSGLVLLWWGMVGGRAVLRLAGGVPDARPVVSVTLLTAAGRRHTQRILVPVARDGSDYPIPEAERLPGGYCVPPNALAAQEGSVLVTPEGAPLVTG